MSNPRKGRELRRFAPASDVAAPAPDETKQLEVEPAAPAGETKAPEAETVAAAAPPPPPPAPAPELAQIVVCDEELLIEMAFG